MNACKKNFRPIISIVMYSEIPAKVLREAAEVAEQLDQLKGRLSALLEPYCALNVSKITDPMPKTRRKFSAATRAKMAASQRARWQKAAPLLRETSTAPSPLSVG